MVGGLDRGLDWTPYMGKIRGKLPNAVIGIPDNGARIIREMQRATFSPPRGLHEAQDLAEAVELAQKLTPPGGIVLLSPGAPSFPQFDDYRDRGDSSHSCVVLSRRTVRDKVRPRVRGEECRVYPVG